MKIEYIENTYSENGTLIKSSTRIEHRDTDQLMTFAEVGSHFGTSRQVVRRWAFQGQIPYEVKGGNYFIRKSEMAKFVRPRRGHKARDLEGVAA